LRIGVATEGFAIPGVSQPGVDVARNDSLRVVDLSLPQERDLHVTADSDYRRIATLGIDPDTILETYAFGKEFLVELADEVRLINSLGSYPLISEPVVQVRTFPNARRYREVILLVRETGVSLLGMYLTRNT